jgi:hypothetical protein
MLPFWMLLSSAVIPRMLLVLPYASLLVVGTIVLLIVCTVGLWLERERVTSSVTHFDHDEHKMRLAA